MDDSLIEWNNSFLRLLLGRGKIQQGRKGGSGHYANDSLIGKPRKSLALLLLSSLVEEEFFLFTFFNAVSKCSIEISNLLLLCLTCSLIAVIAAAFTIAAMSAPVMPSVICTSLSM